MPFSGMLTAHNHSHVGGGCVATCASHIVGGSISGDKGRKEIYIFIHGEALELLGNVELWMFVLSSCRLNPPAVQTDGGGDGG